MFQLNGGIGGFVTISGRGACGEAEGGCGRSAREAESHRGVLGHARRGAVRSHYRALAGFARGGEPNTLYYHFACIEDVAATALAEEIDSDIARMVVGLGSGVADAAGVARLGAADAGRFARIRLFAASGSGALARMLTATLMRTWLSAAGVDGSALSDDSRRDLAFIFGGVVALLGSELADDPAELARVFMRPLGHGVAETMAALAG